MLAVTRVLEVKALPVPLAKVFQPVKLYPALVGLVVGSVTVPL